MVTGKHKLVKRLHLVIDFTLSRLKPVVNGSFAPKYSKRLH